MRAPRRLPWPAGIVAFATILLSLAAAGPAAAATQVRFLHALPGGPTADLSVKGAKGPAATLTGIGFAKASESEAGPSGQVTVTLTAGGKQVATAKEFLADGDSYTIVAEKGSGSKPAFRLYRSGKAVPGKASIRAVHAAPELGRVTMSLSGRGWGTVSYGQDTGYKPADPGTYDLTASKPGSKSPLISQKGLTASAGTASTAYAVGTAGEQTRFVVVADGVAAPSGGPDTGLGGLSGEEGAPWLAALLAALGAGALGGLLYSRAPRGRARG